jgi:D-aminoacyl-tRNA deacylase
MILLVASNKDIASLNIKQQILSCYSFEKMSESFQGNQVYKANFDHKEVRLVTLDQESVYAQNLPDQFSDLELVVFVSRHSSESGTPTLSVHTPGNLGQAELGGLPGKVSVSPANAMRAALKAMERLKQQKQLGYEVSYECTHHGPSLDVPTMFAELGSSLAQWNDLEAAGVVAHAAMEAVSSLGSNPVPAVLGIGGTHYNAKFTRIAFEKELAFGHMIPKYAIPNVDSEMIRQCIERTMETVDHAVLDWKGIKGENKQLLTSMLDETGIRFEKV